MNTWSAQVLRAVTEWDEPVLRSAWQSLAGASASLHAVYASPAWFDCLRQSGKVEDLALVVLRDMSGAIAGVAPVRRRLFWLPFDISSHALYTARFMVVEVLGTTPLVPSERAAYEAILEAAPGIWPGIDAIYFDTVPVDAPLHAFLANIGGGRFAYEIDGRRPWFLMELPESPEAFLASLGPKSRSTLKRKTKKLGEKGGGEARMTRIETPEQVSTFLTQAAAVSRQSWQFRVLGPRISDSADSMRLYQAWAQHGLLRAYLMHAGETPCAFVVGYQSGDVFQYAELGFDAALSPQSPGTVLLFLLIQDLCSHRPVRILNFGMGDAEYKRRFSTAVRADESFLVVPRSVRYRALVLSHRAFRAGVRGVRRLVKREEPPAATPEESD